MFSPGTTVTFIIEKEDDVIFFLIQDFTTSKNELVWRLVEVDCHGIPMSNSDTIEIYLSSYLFSRNVVEDVKITVNQRYLHSRVSKHSDDSNLIIFSNNTRFTPSKINYILDTISGSYAFEFLEYVKRVAKKRAILAIEKM